MKELLIKHESDGQVVKRFRVKPNSDIFTIGSGTKCNIMLPGEEVDPIHAAFELKDGEWHLMDLGSETGTWIENKPIIEEKVNSQVHLKVGLHELIVSPVDVPAYSIFESQNKVDFPGSKTKVYQQIALLYKGQISESFLESPKKTVQVPYDRKRIKITPPKNTSWEEHKFGDLTVKSRLVRVGEFKNPEKNAIWSLFPKDLLQPMGISFGAVVFFLLSLYIIPKALQSDPGGLKENQYTKLMFDQKTIENRKKKAVKLVKALEKEKPQSKKVAQKKKQPKKLAPQKKASGKKVAKKVQAGKKKTVSGAKAQKVVSKLRASGLSSLVGKVSKRAASNSLLVASKGSSGSGSRGRGRGFASIQDLKKGAKSAGSGSGSSFRVGGVSTKGVSGGSSVSSKLGGLSGSGIGKASVSALESETEVSGGLSPEQIARVVKKNIGSVRYCYERQLAANPSLYGKIKVEFIIGASGSIIGQKVKSSTMGNKLVEGCILRKVKRWRFPSPAGGSEVAVSYPFYFKSTK